MADRNTVKLFDMFTSLRGDRYRPAFNPSEIGNLPQNYHDTIVAENFRQKYLSKLTSGRHNGSSAWPLEWFMAVEDMEGITGTSKSLMHLVNETEDGPHLNDDHAVLLADMYRDKMYGVINPFDIPEDYDERKPWEDEAGDGLILDENWTYPCVEMFLNLKPGRGKTADMPQVGYQLWVGYEANAGVNVPPVDEETGEVIAPTDGESYSTEERRVVPGVDVIVALFGPQKPAQRRSKYAPPKRPAVGRYDLYQVHRVPTAADEVALIPEMLEAVNAVAAEGYQLIGQSEQTVSDSAAWRLMREENAAKRWAKKKSGPVTFG